MTYLCTECSEPCEELFHELTTTFVSACCAAPITEDEEDRYCPGLYDPQVDSEEY